MKAGCWKEGGSLSRSMRPRERPPEKAKLSFRGRGRKNLVEEAGGTSSYSLGEDVNPARKANRTS